jgi:putative flippase GtrA
MKSIGNDFSKTLDVSMAVTQPFMASGVEIVTFQRNTEEENPKALRDLVRKVLENWRRLCLFAANGVSVFVIGLLLQIILVRYMGMSHVASYIIQTVISVQVNFLLSRNLTWRDRNIGFSSALIRFNAQQLLVTGTGMAGYAGLEWLGMNYIAANLVVTAVLAPVSFLSSHLWSMGESHLRQPGTHRRLADGGARTRSVAWRYRHLRHRALHRSGERNPVDPQRAFKISSDCSPNIGFPMSGHRTTFDLEHAQV